MDADALNLIAGDENLRKMAAGYSVNGKKLIITPHLAEFARLIGKSVAECKEHILEYPKILSDELNCTVICKDARSIVSDKGSKKIYINVSGNDGMATAGSGDVLAGVVGAFSCLDISSFEAACISTYIHGRAGDLAMEDMGRYSMVASDIAGRLEDILR